MCKIKELKEIIVDLKMELIEANIPRGHCPYSYYSPIEGRKIDCSIDCNDCRQLFMNDMEKVIREEVKML